MARTKRTATLADVLPLVNRMSPLDQARLIGYLLPNLQHAIETSKPGPSESLFGLWKDDGISLSAEDIDEARREMWTIGRDVDRECYAALQIPTQSFGIWKATRACPRLPVPPSMTP